MKRFFILLTFSFGFSAVNAMDSQQAQSSTSSQTEQCKICFDEKERADFVKLHCGHIACRDCLKRLIDTAVRENNVEPLKCPECNKEFIKRDIQALTDNEGSKIDDKIDEILTQKLIAQDKEYRHCPTVDCPFGFLYSAERDDCPQSMSCPVCKKKYCANCLVAHGPELSCSQTQQQGISHELRTSLRERDVRLCPTCGFAIERTDGCDHVTCTRCKQRFCFNCLQPNWHEALCPQRSAPVQNLLREDPNVVEQFVNPYHVRLDQEDQAYQLEAPVATPSLAERLRSILRNRVTLYTFGTVSALGLMDLGRSFILKKEPILPKLSKLTGRALVKTGESTVNCIKEHPLAASTLGFTCMGTLLALDRRLIVQDDVLRLHPIHTVLGILNIALLDVILLKLHPEIAAAFKEALVASINAPQTTEKYPKTSATLMATPLIIAGALSLKKMLR